MINTFRIISIHTHIAESYSLASVMEEHMRFREELRGYADPDNELEVIKVQEVAGDGTVIQEFSNPGPHDVTVKELQEELENMHKDAAGADI